mgnify:CR=1 FL=1
MKWLYAALLLGSVAVPALWTFDKKLKFYPKLPAVFLSIVFIGAFFVIKDVVFTNLGVWGFNPVYYSGIRLAGLPLEEWLFFVVIPYASMFLHETVVFLKPGWKLSDRAANRVTLLLILLAAVMMILFHKRLYTFFDALFLVAVLTWSLLSKSGIINRFFLTFGVILIPFFLVNAVLTGSFIPGEVVWYNPGHFMGFRIFTVPAEDAGYAFSLILGNLLMTDLLVKKFTTAKREKNG